TLAPFGKYADNKPLLSCPSRLAETLAHSRALPVPPLPPHLAAGLRRLAALRPAAPAPHLLRFLLLPWFAPCAGLPPLAVASPPPCLTAYR
ncbi:hypothetical protein U1Q18_027652, partial [Sarracenia purpurea var. burkii]